MIKPDMSKLESSLGGFAQLAMKSIPPSTAYDFAINGATQEKEDVTSDSNEID